jgi:hypothetical protein
MSLGVKNKLAITTKQNSLATPGHRGSLSANTREPTNLVYHFAKKSGTQKKAS